MDLKKLDIKNFVGEQKKSSSTSTSTSKSSSKKTEKDSGSIMGGLAGTAMAALPFIPTKLKVIAGFGIFLIIYGGGSLVYDIVELVIYLTK